MDIRIVACGLAGLVLTAPLWPQQPGLGAAAGERTTMWFTKPAERWLAAVPIGGGRLGAMVFGGLDRERLQLCEDSMWPGHSLGDPTNAAPEQITRWREMLSRGEYVEVDREVMPAFSAGRIVRSHQTMGDLHLDLLEPAGDVADYVRTLDLRDGIAGVGYSRGGVRFRRETLSSAPHQVIAWHVAASQEGTVSFDVHLSRPEDGGEPTVTVAADAGRGRVVMDGRLTQSGATHGDGGPQHRFRVVAEVEADGGSVVLSDDGVLGVRGASAATVWIVGETEWYGDDVEARCDERIAAARGAGWERVRAMHVADHRRLFDRVALDLGVADQLASLPTDERLERVKGGAHDPGLERMLFQFGRYLLMGSSRPGTLPANLQGIWNEHIQAPWNADYHLNINLEMNYWPAEVTNLAELHEPLFEFTERLAENGRRRARDAFGMRGWVTGHATDAWAPAWHRSAQPYWGFWHHGGGWLMQHVVDHWRFTGDDAWMRQRGWPLLAGCARFYVDWLCEDPESGALVSGPSTSPENSFQLADGRRAATCMGPAMDHQIIGRVFRDVLAVSEALDIDAPIVGEVSAALAHLRPGVRLGSDGRVLEWDREVAEVEPGHRHMSHLWALHPGESIDPVATPELAAAARRTIDYRLEHGGAGTGWSRAWMINFMARLHDGEAAWHHLQMLFRRSMAENLFDLHPPFQIDGNFGATAGIAEMLMQSTRGVIEVLPALPAAWPEGSFRGLRARGGFELDVSWSGGAWTGIEVRSTLGGRCTLRLGPDIRVTAGGETVPLEVSSDGTVAFGTVRGAAYRISRAR